MNGLRDSVVSHKNAFDMRPPLCCQSQFAIRFNREAGFAQSVFCLGDARIERLSPRLAPICRGQQPR